MRRSIRGTRRNALRRYAVAPGHYSGIKVDRGAKLLAGMSDENITDSMELRDRLKDYAQLGE
jgi:fructose-bisphosphate aldolase class 1